MLLTVLSSWLVVAICFAILWLIQRRIGDAGIVDVAWASAVGIVASVYCWLADGNGVRRWIVATLAIAWAVRLSWHLWVRLRRLSEDGRYVELKEKWGAQADANMFRFYQYQAAGVIMFAVPMYIAASSHVPINWLDMLGIGIWCLAIGGESIADWQLYRFRMNPAHRGQVCRSGLWRYSRHPNFFFEWLHWWSYVAIALNGPWGVLTLYAPLSMYFLITRVTGIPPTERQAIRSRGAAYREYQRQTNAFFPGPVKSQPVT